MAARDYAVALCSYGGEFTSSSDGTLHYKGGEVHATKITHETLLDDWKAELSDFFNLDIDVMSLKYFLPNNQRTLITISCDRDLQRMVDFTCSAPSVDVFVISKVENRIIIAHSTPSTVASAADARGAKRKRLTSGNKGSKNNTRQADSRTPNAASNLTQNTADKAKQKRPVITENVDNRAFQLDFGSDVAFAAAAAAASSTPDIMKQQKLAVVDVVQREPTGIFDDAITPYVVSDITPESVRGPNSAMMVWDEIIKGVGQEFDNVKDFRAQLCKYAIGKGFVYRFVKNETTRVTVKCVGEGCSWRLHASESSRNKKFVIKKMTDVHTCGGGSGEGQRRATRQWLTTIIKEKLHDNPSYKPKELVRELYEDYGVPLTYSQVWRGREVAQKELYHAVRETYNLLPYYCERLLESNPGSIAMLSPMVDSKFRRFFVAFHASLHGFANGCRPLLFLDKVPLKATNEYKVLTAAAVDADDGIFPVAFNVVEDENYESWVWFLMQLRFAFENHNYPFHSMTFVSSGQKGLDAAVPQVFEDSHHAYCLHHLMEEFKGELKKGPWSQQIRDGMVEDFTRAAQACNVEDFNASIESIRNISTEAADWIIASKPEHWSDAIFRGCRYDHFSSNIVDSFNNWIPAKKEGSIVQMMDSLRIKIMEVMQARREAGKAWTGPLAPSMEYKLQNEIGKARKLNVLCSSETVFEVRGNIIFVVNLARWECTCRRWQISGLPCMHAIAVFDRIGRSYYDYCSKYFRIESYHMTYSGTIFPIPDMETFDFSAGANLIPPPKQRSSDKPRRRRFNPNKISTVIRLCSRCKQAGHNKATCEALL